MSYTAILFAGYAVCSIAMTLLNKRLASSFKLPFMTILLQNLGAIASSLLMIELKWKNYRKLKPSHVFSSFINGVWLIVMIWTSLLALRDVSVPMYVIAGNARPLCSAIIEFAWFHRGISWTKLLGLALVVAGAFFYVRHDGSSTPFGFVMLCLNTILCASLGVYENQLMNRFKNEQTAFGVNFNRMILSTPPLILVIFLTEDVPGALEQVDTLSLYLLIASSVFCLGIGVIMFALQPLVCATTIQVGNVCFKIITTVSSLIFFPTEIASIAWLGYGISMWGFILYSFGDTVIFPRQTRTRGKAGYIRAL